jgi:hypothetical protein
MKKKLFKGLFYVLLGYLALVALRFIYLELGGSDDHSGALGSGYDDKMKESVVQMAMPQLESSVRNYASVNFEMPAKRREAGRESIEQKYEKVASLSTATEKYDEDQQKARAVIKAHNALIQEEAVNNYGELNRLSLIVGIPPGEFDATVADLKLIGKVQDFQITKTDKTNDFLQLRAKRLSLEKTRDSLIALKAQGGKIDELVKLEQEILSLEGRIQEFGVQLGQFDKVNEFCTVRFSLTESKPEVVRSPHFGYLIVSIEWASGIYLLWLGIACVGLVTIVLLLIIVEKSKLFRAET